MPIQISEKQDHAASLKNRGILTEQEVSQELSKQPNKLSKTTVNSDMTEDDIKELAQNYTPKEINSFLTAGLTRPVFKKLTYSKDVVFSANDSVNCIQTCINMGKIEYDKAIGRRIIVVIGDTGAGKSTSVNYLVGCKMKTMHLDGNDVVVVSEDSDPAEVMPIGHAGSKTFFPQVAVVKKNGVEGELALCDCPGFFDGRGPEINIANAVNIKNTIKKARSVTVLLLINFEEIKARRGEIFRTIQATLDKFFGSPDSLIKHQSSILIGLTKVPLETMVNRRHQPLSASDAIDRFYNEGKTFAQSAWFPQELRANTLILDPLGDRDKEGYTRARWLEALKQLKPIPDHQTIFNAVIGAEETVLLNKISRDISQQIKTSLEKKAYETAFADLECMHYLTSLKHKEVEALFAGNVKDVHTYFRGVLQNIRELAESFECQAADEALRNLIDSVNLFKELIPGLQTELLETVKLNNSKRVEKLRLELGKAIRVFLDCFYKNKDRALQEKLAYPIHQLLKTVHGNDVKFSDFSKGFEQFGALKELAEAIDKALKMLHQVTVLLNIPDIYAREHQSLINYLREMDHSAQKIYEDAAEKLLANIAIVLSENMAKLKEAMSWENNGEGVLNVLMGMTPKNFLIHLQSLSDKIHLKTEAQTVHKNLVEVIKINETLTSKNNFSDLPQKYYEELMRVRSRLEDEKKAAEIKAQKENDRLAVRKFIQDFQKNLVARKFELLHDLHQQMGYFNQEQQSYLKNEIHALSTVLKTELDKALRELIEKMNWDEHGEALVSSYELANKNPDSKNAFEFIPNLLFSFLREKSMQKLRDPLRTFQHFYHYFTEIAKVDSSLEDSAYLFQFQGVYKEFVKIKVEVQKKKQEALLRQEAQQLVEEINQTLLLNNNFERVNFKLTRLKEIAPDQLQSIAMTMRINTLIEAFKKSLQSRQYASVMQNLKLLETMHHHLREFITGLNLFSKINELKLEICECVGKKSIEAKDEIKQAFSLDAIQKILPLKDFPELNHFFQLVTQFNALDTIPKFHIETADQITSMIQVLLNRHDRGEDSPEVYAKLLTQIQCLTNAIGSKDAVLTTTIESMVRACLQKQAEKIEFLTAVDMRLSRLSAMEDKDSQYAHQVISQYPEFKGARNRAFIVKTQGRTTANIVQEIQGVNHRSLEAAFQEYQKEYSDIVNSIHEAYGTRDDQKVLRDTKYKARFSANQLAKRTTPDYFRDHRAVALMLANIFGAWAYLDAHQGGFIPKSTVLRIPHSSQIAAIFLLFGIGLDQPIQNQLLEVKTGEGKSIVSAGAAIAFALIGFVVDIACYNPYLAERDASAFSELIDSFELGDKITYGDFHYFVNLYIKQLGDPRELAMAFLKQQPISAKKISVPEKSVLFVDEVDVLFGDKFMGKQYNPAISLTSLAFRRLVLKLWDNADDYLKLTESEFVRALHEVPEMQDFKKEYPGLTEYLLNVIIHDLRNGLEEVHAGNHPYICENGKIGYKDIVSNTIRWETFHNGTPFAAAKEFRANGISEDLFEKKVRGVLKVGNLSYAELTKKYTNVVGVSGTLFPLMEHEEAMLQHSNIRRKTAIPTVFSGKKLLPKESLVQVFDGEFESDDQNVSEGYFLSINKSIEEKIKADRAVLVIFETEERLDTFNKQFSHFSTSIGIEIVNKLYARTLSENRDLIIREAAKRKTVTLMVCAYGRGSDFICHDDGLRSKGGVAVISTFFPRTELEEIQYKGRTCRQNDPGSFEMILHLKDLAWLGVKTITELEKTDSSIYGSLSERRKMKLNEEGKEIRAAVTKAEFAHNISLSLLSHLSLFASGKRDDAQTQVINRLFQEVN